MVSNWKYKGGPCKQCGGIGLAVKGLIKRSFSVLYYSNTGAVPSEQITCMFLLQICKGALKRQVNQLSSSNIMIIYSKLNDR